MTNGFRKWIKQRIAYTQVKNNWKVNSKLFRSTVRVTRKRYRDNKNWRQNTILGRSTVMKEKMLLNLRKSYSH